MRVQINIFAQTSDVLDVFRVPIGEMLCLLHTPYCWEQSMPLS